jgi:2-aminoadipate transaminase
MSSDTAASPFTLARRTARMNPSIIREILKVTERPGIISLAGGLPSADTFPVEAIREATTRVLRDAPREAMQYAASEGYGPLREWVAQYLAARQGMDVSPTQVLVTNGSQQGLDLAAKVLIDTDVRVLVETPTYLGAVQAFTPYEPRLEGLASDARTAPGCPRRRRAQRPFRLPAAELPEPQATCRERGARRWWTGAGRPSWSRTTSGDLW